MSPNVNIFITTDQNIVILNSRFNFIFKIPSNELHGNYQWLDLPHFLGRGEAIRVYWFILAGQFPGCHVLLFYFMQSSFSPFNKVVG